MSDVVDVTHHVPIDCPVCELMMRDARDVAQFYASGCCIDCWIGFLEPLRLRIGDTTYLPNSAEVQAYREKIRIHNLEKEQC